MEALSNAARRENYWLYKSVFKENFKDVLFDLQAQNDMIDEPYSDGNFKAYNIINTPAILLIDTKTAKEMLIGYEELFNSSRCFEGIISQQLTTFQR